MPRLVGAAAVADERRLGTLEGAACLPVSRRRQFGIKLALVLVLGWCLGALVPWVLEGNEGVIGAQLNVPGLPAWWASVNGLFYLLLLPQLFHVRIPLGLLPNPPARW